MNAPTDLESRLTATLQAKAHQVDSAVWPAVPELAALDLRAAVAPGRRGQGRGVWLAVAAVALVVVLIGVGLGLRSGPHTSSPSDTESVLTSTDAVAALAKMVALSHDPSLLAQVGQGTATPSPQPIDDAPLTLDGKPEVLYIGAEYCPFCAAERWALVLALSRFGTFDNLDATASATDDVDPGTPSFTFHDSSYTSDELAFVGVETEDSAKAPLDRLTPQESDVMTKQDASGSIPFVDIGGRYVLVGADYDPGLLAGKTMGEIASAMADPSTAISQAVVGAANQIVTAICQVTGQQPASVCSG
jgi:Domain of unknown function (DUF929)